MERERVLWVVMLMCVLAVGSFASAVDIATVHVGDPGNVGELSGGAGGYYGPDRICGAVAYEYNIGKYEVTAGQYKDFLNAVAATDTYGLYNPNMWSDNYGCKIQQSGSSGSYTYSVASDWANRPVNNVGWGDAARFANWLHNGQPVGLQSVTTTEDGAYFLNGATSVADLMVVSRKTGATWAITNEDEWYKAAYYKGGSTNAGYWDYPTRSNTAPGQDMADVSGNNANYYTAPYAYPIDNGKYTTVVGEFQNSASPYGTFDQGGNVMEWNDAVIGTYHGARGGSFGGSDLGLLASFRNDYINPTYELNTVGFRVSEVPEPCSLALLLVGGLALRSRKP